MNLVKNRSLSSVSLVGHIFSNSHSSPASVAVVENIILIYKQSLSSVSLVIPSGVLVFPSKNKGISSGNMVYCPDGLVGFWWVTKH
jgi:hypothetical protein